MGLVLFFLIQRNAKKKKKKCNTLLAQIIPINIFFKKTHKIETTVQSIDIIF